MVFVHTWGVFHPEKQRYNRLTFVHPLVNLFLSIQKRTGYTDIYPGALG